MICFCMQTITNIKQWWVNTGKQFIKVGVISFHHIICPLEANLKSIYKDEKKCLSIKKWPKMHLHKLIYLFSNHIVITIVHIFHSFCSQNGMKLSSMYLLSIILSSTIVYWHCPVLGLLIVKSWEEHHETSVLDYISYEK